MKADDLHAALDSLSMARGRALWETMQEIFAVAPEHLEVLHADLPALIQAGGRGSVIARDHLVRILALLMADARFADDAIPVYLATLRDAPANQFPMYAELGAAVVPEAELNEFERLLVERLGQLSEPKQRRVNAVLKNL
ncbi:MAG: hypothetical protein M3Q98_11705 [Actinomycetota bacterium]|nr:hypothetical protein [Actinomycetota bacterium]